MEILQYILKWISIANRKEWNFNNVDQGLALIYDFGIFNAKVELQTN